MNHSHTHTTRPQQRPRGDRDRGVHQLDTQAQNGLTSTSTRIQIQRPRAVSPFLPVVTGKSLSSLVSSGSGGGNPNFSRSPRPRPFGDRDHHLVRDSDHDLSRFFNYPSRERGPYNLDSNYSHHHHRDQHHVVASASASESLQGQGQGPSPRQSFMDFANSYEQFHGVNIDIKRPVGPYYSSTSFTIEDGGQRFSNHALMNSSSLNWASASASASASTSENQYEFPQRSDGVLNFIKSRLLDTDTNTNANPSPPRPQPQRRQSLPNANANTSTNANFAVPRQAGGPSHRKGKLIKKSTKHVYAQAHPRAPSALGTGPKVKTGLRLRPSLRPRPRPHLRRKHRPAGLPKCAVPPVPKVVDGEVAAKVKEEWKKYYAKLDLEGQVAAAAAAVVAQSPEASYTATATAKLRKRWPSTSASMKVNSIELSARKLKADQLAKAQKPKPRPMQGSQSQSQSRRERRSHPHRHLHRHEHGHEHAHREDPSSQSQSQSQSLSMMSRTGRSLIDDFYLDFGSNFDFTQADSHNHQGIPSFFLESQPPPQLLRPPSACDAAAREKLIKKLVRASAPVEADPFDSASAWIQGQGLQSIKLPSPFHSKDLPTRRTEVLLQLWIESGPFSKLDTLVVSARVMCVTEAPDSDSETLEKAAEFNTFCAQLNLYVELFKKPEAVRDIYTKDYRTLWRLYGIFTQAVQSGISNYGDALNSPHALLEPNFMLMAAAAPGITSMSWEAGNGNGNGNSNGGLCQHEKFIQHYNSAILDTLSSTGSGTGGQNSLKAFLVTYGRLVESSRVQEFGILKANPLNEHIQRYFEQFSSTIPGTYSALPRHLENQLRPNPIPKSKVESSKSTNLAKVTKAKEHNNVEADNLKKKTDTNSGKTGTRLKDKKLDPVSGSVTGRGKSHLRAGLDYHCRQEKQSQKPNLESFNLSNLPVSASSESEANSSLSSCSSRSQSPSVSVSVSGRDQTEEDTTTATDTNTITSVGSSKAAAVRSHELRLHRIRSTPRSICVKNCQFKIIKRVAEEVGFRLVDERSEWNVFWSDTPLTADKLTELRRVQDARQVFDPQPGSSRRPPPPAPGRGGASNSSTPRSRILQKLNHFPGMNEICRKDRLARNLKRMKKYFPKDFDFFPETWTLPTDLGRLVYHSKRRRNSTFICKPDTGSMGRGIFLVQDLRKLNPFTKLICQVYIQRPFLIDGYKFDLRLYVLITSCDPLRVYVYNEGIARFATVKYAPPNESNLEVTFMHLTNYSLNKFSQSYVPEGSKRKLSLVLEWMRTQGYDVDKLLADIDSVLVKTMISAHQSLKHYYRSFFPRLDQGCVCFEVLGFDVLIDERMKPYLIEVNHSPSFSTELPVDEEIKRSLIQDTLDKIYLGDSVPDKRSMHMHKGKGRGPGRGGRSESPSFMLKTKGPDGSLLTPTLQKQFQHEAKHGGNYRLIYPTPENVDLYKSFISHANAMDCGSTDMEKGSERLNVET